MATVSNRTVITGLIFLNLLLVIFIVLSFVRNRQVSPMGPEFLIYELKLDSDQISLYKYLLDSNKNVMGPMLNELKLAKQEFFNEISSASVTESVLLEKQAAINAIQNKIDRAMLHHLHQLFLLCNEAQRQKLLGLLHRLGEQMPG